MQNASILVVGGGIMGASAAYHLAARGAKDVLVIDSTSSAGLGSTGAATGGFRCQFSSAVNVRLSLMARAKLRTFLEETGVDPEYAPFGYLFLAESDARLANLRKGIETQRSCGLHEVREVTREEARELNPLANLDGILGGAYCPTDGFMRPLKIMEGYIAAAKRLGVRFEYDVDLKSATVRNERVVSVQTSAGSIEADHYVNAAGAWAGKVGQIFGSDVPVTPAPRHVAATLPTDLFPGSMTMTVWLEDGFHARVRDGRVLLIWTTPKPPKPSFSTQVDRAWLKKVYMRAMEAFPILSTVGLDVAGSWAGLYEMSPDKTAILGRAPGIKNLYLVNGSSGHGVMHSPALGQLLAEILLDGAAKSLDVSALSPTRFAEGRPNPSGDVL